MNFICTYVTIITKIVHIKGCIYSYHYPNYHIIKLLSNINKYNKVTFELFFDNKSNKGRGRNNQPNNKHLLLVLGK